MNYIQEIFPTNISFGAICTSEFSTNIAVSLNKEQLRNVNWQEPRLTYNLAPAIKNLEQMEMLMIFFKICKGRAYSFRFKDWTDYKVSKQKIGIGDGIKDEFQLIKTYDICRHQYSRIIHTPVLNSVNIYINNKKQNNFEVNYETGIIKFINPPRKNSIITSDFEFYILARFDNDKLNIRLDNSNIFFAENIIISEVKI